MESHGTLIPKHAAGNWDRQTIPDVFGLTTVFLQAKSLGVFLLLS